MESVDLTTSPTVPCVSCGEIVPLSLLGNHNKCCPGGSSSGIKNEISNSEEIAARKDGNILELSKKVHISL